MQNIKKDKKRGLCIQTRKNDSYKKGKHCKNGNNGKQ